MKNKILLLKENIFIVIYRFLENYIYVIRMVISLELFKIEDVSWEKVICFYVYWIWVGYFYCKCENIVVLCFGNIMCKLSLW